jgi:hypothetical protein
MDPFSGQSWFNSALAHTIVSSMTYPLLAFSKTSSGAQILRYRSQMGVPEQIEKGNFFILVD